MSDREKVIKGLECCHNKNMLWQHDQCPYHGFDEDCEANLHADALALLKEQDKQVKQWTKEIADNQLAHAPDERNPEEWDYRKGIWDGLQIAWNIISEVR